MGREKLGSHREGPFGSGMAKPFWQSERQCGARVSTVAAVVVVRPGVITAMLACVPKYVSDKFEVIRSGYDYSQAYVG